MKAISRRKFMQMAGAMFVAVAACPVWSGAKAKNGEKRVRIRPVSFANLRPGEISLYRRARFATAADAMRAVASRRMTAHIYTE